MSIRRQILTAAAVTALGLPMIGAGASALAADIPPAVTPATPTVAAAAPENLAAHGDIAETLQASGQFTILIKALDQTNLTAVLKTHRPLTLIAPTDAAFQALPAGQLDNLMKPENAQQLQSLLTYHVINAAAPLAKVEGTKGSVATVNGAKVQIDGSGQVIKFNDADVTAMSTTTNGSIYVVDKVLTPAAATASIKPAATPGG
jgi:uncharacterized surface protein with fasciclin (FAS1) repeats